ncbi:division/cell wall cluster transcriptional repressor MraZ [Oceanivirga salmonicida]|nr:division/cell wall cluster transcriptional repressor MraZ [Oceanivirga salmonicida]
MFVGEYSCKIDSKGRITMPSKFREQLTKPFTITKGFDNSIQLFPENEWIIKTEELKKLKDTNSSHRIYKRFISGSAVDDLEFDAQGRIKLPQALIKHSQIEKDVVVIGNNEKIEIWSKEIWDKYVDDSNENIEDIVEGIEF